jgi:cytochrome c-type biogenesis protein
MNDVSLIGPATALAAGAVSFLSPCVLPLVPGYVSYVVGSAATEREDVSVRAGAALMLSAFFVLGFATVFIALGATATALGQLFAAYRETASTVGSIVVITFGLFMIGVLKMPWLARDIRFHRPIAGGNPFGAYLMGLAFAFGWTPCIGPVLGAILTASALSATASQGVVLLAIYSAGLGVPFLLTAVLAHRAARPLAMMRRVGRSLQVLAGLIMVLMGIAMLTGYTTAFALWMLRALPFLGTIG